MTVDPFRPFLKKHPNLRRRSPLTEIYPKFTKPFIQIAGHKNIQHNAIVICNINGGEGARYTIASKRDSEWKLWWIWSWRGLTLLQRLFISERAMAWMNFLSELLKPSLNWRISGNGMSTYDSGEMICIIPDTLSQNLKSWIEKCGNKRKMQNWRLV